MSAKPDDAAPATLQDRGVWGMGRDLAPRVAASAVMGAVAIVVAWLGGIVFVAFWWLAAVVVLWEWQRIVGNGRLAARVAVGGLLQIGAALMAFHNSPLSAIATSALAAGAVGFVAVRNPLWAGAGALYAGALVVSLSLLRASPNYGLPAIIWLFAIVWGADVAAYFAGRAIGGPRLWPRVSPGKTWSGAVAGVVAGAALGLAVSLILVPGSIRIEEVFLLGLAAAVVSELGDLFESAFKRRFGVKDSSRLIPGHGGFMDRLDSFVAASIFAALVAAANSRGSFIASGLFLW
jgi:phosphatidate cytidylyltransferase